MKNATIDNIELSTTHKLQVLSSHQLNGAARLPLPNLNEIINLLFKNSGLVLVIKIVYDFYLDTNIV